MHKTARDRLGIATVIGILAICCLVLGYLLWIRQGLADPESMPAAQSAAAGDTLVVNVYANDLDDVYGYQFYLWYDPANLEYQGHLASSIEEIPLIFAADQSQPLLVGATMVGSSSSYSGNEVLVCQIELVALADCDLGQIAVTDVNIVTSDLRYIEDEAGWTTAVYVK